MESAFNSGSRTSGVGRLADITTFTPGEVGENQ
jgi:hypothetical protein